MHITLYGVSVPLRGKGRDQLYVPFHVGGFVEKFPSPCGEKVGINVRRTALESHLATSTFPSPCGEKVGINTAKVGTLHQALSIVSVPLRGKGRDQRPTEGLQARR